MNMRRSKVLEKLRAGKPAICTKTNLIDPRSIEIMCMASFDCIWLCMEHIPMDWMTVENQVRAAKMYDTDTLVRIAKGSYSDYIRPLEADATGIMVPHLMTAAEARDVVHWTRFQPLGRRPVDGGNMDAAFTQLPMTEYTATANRERFVIVQIEDPEPMDELEEIVAVEGIDMVLFGPGDFSHGLGIPGQTRAPEVVAARRRVAEVCRAHGRFAGTTATLEMVPELIDEGFNFLSVGADVVFLGQAFNSLHDELCRLGVLD